MGVTNQSHREHDDGHGDGDAEPNDKGAGARPAPTPEWVRVRVRERPGDRSPQLELQTVEVVGHRSVLRFA